MHRNSRFVPLAAEVMRWFKSFANGQKQKLAHKAIQSAVQDVRASVINLLIDVPGTMRDFESPAA